MSLVNMASETANMQHCWLWSGCPKLPASIYFFAEETRGTHASRQCTQIKWHNKLYIHSKHAIDNHS